VQIYVSGNGPGACSGRDPNVLDVRLNKTTYKPGDIAHAIIQSPFPSADILVSVVRSGVMWQQLLHASGSAPTVSFTVTSRDAAECRIRSGGRAPRCTSERRNGRHRKRHRAQRLCFL